MPLARKLTERMAQFLPMRTLLKLTGNPSIFPYYHLVTDHTPWYFDHSYPVKSIKAFERELDLFLHYWQPISLQELIQKVSETGAPPVNCVHVSFDDGYREIYDFAYPILKRKGIPATTFICTGLLDNANWHWENLRELIRRKIFGAPDAEKKLISSLLYPQNVDLQHIISGLSFSDHEKLRTIGGLLGIDFESALKTEKPYLTSEQIKTMIKDGFTFGAHSVDHPLFQALSPDEQVSQIIQSTRQIVSSFNLPCKVFAFPYGEFDLPKSLFEKTIENYSMDLFFGTRGIIGEANKLIIQRLWMETTSQQAVSPVKKELSRKIVRLLAKNDCVKRK